MKKATQILSGIAILIFCQAHVLTMSLKQQFKDGKITTKQYYEKAKVYKAVVIKKYKGKGKFKVMISDGKRLRCFIAPTSSLKVKDINIGSTVVIKVSPKNDEQGRIYIKIRDAF